MQYRFSTPCLHFVALSLGLPLVVAFGAAASLHAAEARPWATATGKVMRGVLIAYENDTAFIKLDDQGRIQQIKVEFLAPEDRDYIERRRGSIPNFAESQRTANIIDANTPNPTAAIFAPPPTPTAATDDPMLAMPPGELPPRTRNWLRNDGKSVEATFEGLDGDIVRISRAGKEYRIPITTLTPADQAIARRLATAPAPEPAMAPVPTAPPAWLGIVRQWTSADGKVVEASLEGVDQGVITLSKDGRQFRIPYTKLSPADQQFLRDNTGLDLAVPPPVMPPAPPALSPDGQVPPGANSTAPTRVAPAPGAAAGDEGAGTPPPAAVGTAKGILSAAAGGRMPVDVD